MGCQVLGFRSELVGACTVRSPAAAAPSPVSTAGIARSEPEAARTGVSTGDAPGVGRLLAKLFAGLLTATAVLLVILAGATLVVNAIAPASDTRVSRTAADRLAAAAYRQARSECQQQAFQARDSCIAAAHAREGQVRTKVLSRRGYAATAAEATASGAAPAALVIDPACDLTARGQKGACEIQVRSDGPARLAVTNLIQPAPKEQLVRGSPLPATAQLASAARPEAVAAKPAATRIRLRPAPDRVIEMAWSARQ